MEFSLDSLQPKERASFALRALYEAAGCRKYHMGRFEEYGLYQENRSFLSSEQVITFTDLDGRLLALKPDVTLSIAKTAQPAPGETLRYYYHENVYRPSAESHTFQEISQMGLEMLGAVGEAQVQQAVRLAAQSLAQLGAAWVLEVSHMGYLFGLFDALGVPENARPGLLEKLREHGYVLAVATSKPEVYTLRILEHFDLFKYFTAVAGCDIHRAGETKADMIRLALRRLGLPEQEPPQTVMIGDRKHDVLGAKECRVPCIGVRYGYAEAGELEQYGADWVTDSVETLGKLLL